jgi:hypothetical protein
VCKSYTNDGPAPNSTLPPLCGVLCALTPRATHAQQGRARWRRRDVLLCTRHINTRRPFTPFPLRTNAMHATALSPHNALTPLLHVKLKTLLLFFSLALLPIIPTFSLHERELSIYSMKKSIKYGQLLKRTYRIAGSTKREP